MPQIVTDVWQKKKTTQTNPKLLFLCFSVWVTALWWVQTNLRAPGGALSYLRGQEVGNTDWFENLII